MNCKNFIGKIMEIMKCKEDECQEKIILVLRVKSIESCGFHFLHSVGPVNGWYAEVMHRSRHIAKRFPIAQELPRFAVDDETLRRRFL